MEAAAVEDGEPGRPWSSLLSLGVGSGSGGGRRGHKAEEEDRWRPSAAGGGKILFASAVGDNEKCVGNPTTVQDANQGMHVRFYIALLKSVLCL